MKLLSSTLKVFTFWIIIQECHTFINNWELKAVYSFDSLENEYLKGKKMYQLNFKTWSLEFPDETKNVCIFIFTSAYFEYRQEMLIDMGNEFIQTELKEKYPTIFHQLYKVSKKKKLSLHRPKNRNSYTYTNAYVQREVFLQAKHGYTGIEEFVFTCPIRDKRSNAIKEYFVSKEYNIPLEQRGRTHYRPVRFIFARNPTKEELVVHALAERPAYVLKGGNIELHYLHRKTDVESVEKVEDEICMLSDVNKLRICTMILNSSEYKNAVKFWPHLNNVGKTCEKRDIQFRTKDVEHEKNLNHRPSKEWTISCRAESRDNNRELLYFVSKGYDHRKVFVYETSREKLVLDREAVLSF